LNAALAETQEDRVRDAPNGIAEEE
jgi:hypothetical protein